jgi:zinc protease
MRTRMTLTALLALVLVSGPGMAQRQNPPSPQILDKVNFPPYQARTLDNGLRVFALEHPEQPVLSIQLIIGAGGVNDPADMPGLATFTTDLLDTGTTTRSSQEIAETIDAAGGSISTRAAREGIIVTASVLKDSTDLAFELMTDIVMNPAFAPDEIERLRQQAGSGMMASLQDPDFLADSSFIRALYGTHPYAHPADGTMESITEISRDDIVQYHQTYFAPNASALAIAGAVTSEEAFQLATRWFGDWERRDVPGVDLSELPPVAGRRIIVVDDPNSVQTEIRIGQTTVSRKDADYFPILVASYVLGGQSGRLMDSLRVERGLTYGAYETIIPRKGPGALYAVTETRTEKTVEAVQLILGEIDRLRSDQVPEDELEQVKAFLVGSFPLTIETPGDLGSRLANLAVYDLGAEYLATYRDRLSSVSAADVARVAQNIRTDDVLIVLVGKAEEFLEELAALGSVEVIPLQMLDLNSPTLRNPEQQ